MNQDRSLAFRLAYLLGGKENKLRHDFPDEYAKSDGLELFKNYKDAKKLRLLCELRNSVLADYPKYSKGLIKSLDGFQNIPHKNISYLHNEGIKINKLFYDFDLVDYFNMLTELIDTIVYKVVLDLELPEDLLEYFKFPMMKESEIALLSEELSSVKTPYYIYLYNGVKVKSTLKYAFNSDVNCIKTAYSLRGNVFVGDIAVIPFEYRKEMGEDLEESDEKIQEIIQRYKELKENRVEETRLAKEKAEKEKLEKERLEQERIEKEKHIRVEKESESYIKEKEERLKVENIIDTKDINKLNDSVLIVDCMNTDFLTFVCFLKKALNVKNIVLINNSQKNYIWNTVKNIISGDINIEFINIEDNLLFIANNDVCITHSICQFVYKYGIKNIQIMSDNVSFYNIFELIPNVEFTVYTVNVVDIPMRYVFGKLVCIEDISTVCDKYIINRVDKDIVNYSILHYILNHSLTEYNENEMLEDIKDKLHISELETLKRFEEYFIQGKQNISVFISDCAFQISNGEYTVKK